MDLSSKHLNIFLYFCGFLGMLKFFLKPVSVKKFKFDLSQSTCAIRATRAVAPAVPVDPVDLVVAAVPVDPAVDLVEAVDPAVDLVEAVDHAVEAGMLKCFL
ncbi:hypothetical protein ACLKA7_001183 [Drosophila subpalustris]